MTEPAVPPSSSQEATGPETPPGARRALDWARKFELVSVIVVALLSPLIAGAGIWYSNSQISEQLQLDRQGQLTDRYTKAVENLGDDAVDVRLGGIYALQRIMEDSPRDQPTVANVLATYIRTHTARPPRESEEVAGDVAAALTVLAYRDRSRDGTFTLDLRHTHLPHIELPPLSDGTPADPTHAALVLADLTDADLNHANLTGAALGAADLTEADLNHANLTDAALVLADLTDADLNHANLTGAALGAADLHDANLSHANLTGAALGAADLTGTDLTGADLTDTDLTDTTGLEVQQVLSARIVATTKLPARIARDPAIKARVAEKHE